MAKYTIELGGFVSVFRHRKMTVYANSEAEAIDKATDRWYMVQQADGCSMCGDPVIDSVEKGGDE